MWAYNSDVFSTTSVADALMTTPALLQTLLGHLPPALHTQRPAGGGWCINEIVGHLIAADHFAFAERIELMLAQEHPTIPAVDVDRIAQKRQDHLRTLVDLLDELDAQRHRHVDLIHSLSAEQLTRTGHYTKYGDFRVSDFVCEWAYHDYAHVQQILELLKSAIWPYFSPTMKQALRSTDD